MRFFVDTAKIEDIKKANEMGVICGVTTNPSLIAKEGRRSQEEVLKEIASIVDGPISGEVKATTVDAEGMIAEGREMRKGKGRNIKRTKLKPIKSNLLNQYHKLQENLMNIIVRMALVLLMVNTAKL